MLIDYLKLAISSLTKRKTRTYLTMIGIFIGIAAVVALMGLGEGLRGAIVGQFGFLGPDVLSVQASGINFGPPGQGAVNPLTEDLQKKIERINGVEAAIIRIIESGTYEFNDQQDIGFAWTVPHGRDRKIFEGMINLKVQQGRLLKDADTFKAVLGANFLEEDNEFGKALKLGNKISFSGKDFEVVGFLEKKGSFIFDNVLIMNEEIMRDNFRSDDTVDVIAVKVQDLSLVSKVKADIEKFLRKERDVDEGEEDFTVQSPQNALQSLDDTLFAMQLFVSIIAFISIIVGGIGITNTMYTSVLERTKEIGIMKSLGAKNSTIFTLFFLESGFLGMVGGIVGVGIGLSLAYGFAAVGRAALGSELIQADVSFALVFGALFFSVVVGLAAGIIPAYQASKKHPVDSLRFAK